MTTLDLNTFSRTPAGHYLVRRLNELDCKPLTRACTVRINAFRTNTNDICSSVYSDAMTAKVAANLLRLLREDATRIQLDSYPDTVFVSQLLRNVIIGNIKMMMRKISTIRKIENGNRDENTLKRKGSVESISGNGPNSYRDAIHYTILGYKAGTIFPGDGLYREVPNIMVVNDPTTPEILHARSLKRCTRQQKEWTNGL